MLKTLKRDESVDLDNQLEELERAGIVIVEDDDAQEPVMTGRVGSSISMEDLKRDLIRHGGIEFLQNDQNFEPKWKIS